MPTPRLDRLPNSQVEDLYEADFYAWTQQQAELLRRAGWHQLDLPNLIEEIECLGKQQRQELQNRLRVLIGHLLKWEYQSTRRSRSWLATLRVQRRSVLRLLKDNPSLKPDLSEALSVAYEDAVDLAVGETNLPFTTFPGECPYSLDEILSDRFYPGPPTTTDITD